MREFTITEIEQAHKQVKSGADFPNYIKKINELGVKSLETWVSDSHTNYLGTDNYKISSLPKYEELSISKEVNREQFQNYLKIHQQGETDYYTFCMHCANTGIEKWVVSLEDYSCIYYDAKGIVILKEEIPH